MWKRYSARLRKTIVLALEEAARCRARWRGSHHLLLAMTRDGDSASSMMLKYCGIDPAKLGRAIEASFRTAGTIHHSSPDAGNAQPTFDDEAMKLLEDAVARADSLGEKHAGTEHLLLAVIDSGNAIISKLSVDSAEARDALSRWIKGGLSRRRWGPAPRRVRSAIARKPHCRLQDKLAQATSCLLLPRLCQVEPRSSALRKRSVSAVSQASQIASA